jgi:hypothetical protein
MNITIILLVIFLLLLISLGIYFMSKRNNANPIRTVRTFTLTDIHGTKYEIQKLSNDLIFDKKDNSIIFNYSYTSTNEAPRSEFPNPTFFELKSNRAIPDSIVKMKDIEEYVNESTSPITCQSINKTRVAGCSLKKGAYYQAIIVIFGPDIQVIMERELEKLYNDYANEIARITDQSILQEKAAKFIKDIEDAQKNIIKEYNIKDKFLLSDAKQYNDTDGFDDYTTIKKTNNLTGFTNPNKLISKEYYPTS